MTIQANIPDFLVRQAADVAKREGLTMDSIIAIALSSQVTAWHVRDTVEQRSERGHFSDLDEILADVPDVAPVVGDEK